MSELVRPGRGVTGRAQVLGAERGWQESNTRGHSKRRITHLGTHRRGDKSQNLGFSYLDLNTGEMTR